MGTNRVHEFRKLANDTIISIEKRANAFEKLAVTGQVQRNVLEKELNNTRKYFDKIRQEHNRLNNELYALQQKAEEAKKQMQNTKNKILDLTNAIQIMDLTGAQARKLEKNNEYSYVIDGRRYHTDVSNVEDIKLTPWKEYMSVQRDKAKAEDAEIEQDITYIASNLDDAMDNSEIIDEDDIDPDDLE